MVVNYLECPHLVGDAWLVMGTASQLLIKSMRSRRRCPKYTVNKLFVLIQEECASGSLDIFDPNITKRDTFFKNAMALLKYKPMEEVKLTLESGITVSVFRIDFYDRLQQHLLSDAFGWWPHQHRPTLSGWPMVLYANSGNWFLYLLLITLVSRNIQQTQGYPNRYLLNPLLWSNRVCFKSSQVALDCLKLPESVLLSLHFFVILGSAGASSMHCSDCKIENNDARQSVSNF